MMLVFPFRVFDEHLETSCFRLYQNKDYIIEFENLSLVVYENIVFSDANSMINEDFFRKCQHAVLYYVFSKRHKNFVIRKICLLNFFMFRRKIQQIAKLTIQQSLKNNSLKI